MPDAVPDGQTLNSTACGIGLVSSISAFVTEIPLNTWLAIFGLAWSVYVWCRGRSEDKRVERLRAENSRLRSQLDRKPEELQDADRRGHETVGQ